MENTIKRNFTDFWRHGSGDETYWVHDSCMAAWGMGNGNLSVDLFRGDLHWFTVFWYIYICTYIYIIYKGQKNYPDSWFVLWDHLKFALYIGARQVVLRLKSFQWISISINGIEDKSLWSLSKRALKWDPRVCSVFGIFTWQMGACLRNRRKNRWLYDRKAEIFIPKRVVSVYALIWVAILKDGRSLMIAMTTHQRFQLHKRGTHLHQL